MPNRVKLWEEFSGRLESVERVLGDVEPESSLSDLK
jgi:hypothetical protein